MPERLCSSPGFRTRVVTSRGFTSLHHSLTRASLQQPAYQSSGRGEESERLESRGVEGSLRLVADECEFYVKGIRSHPVQLVSVEALRFSFVLRRFAGRRCGGSPPEPVQHVVPGGVFPTGLPFGAVRSFVPGLEPGARVDRAGRLAFPRRRASPTSCRHRHRPTHPAAATARLTSCAIWR